MTVLNFMSKPSEPIVTKFHIEPPWAEGRKVSSNSPDHMTVMAVMPVHGKNLENFSLWHQWTDCLEI